MKLFSHNNRFGSSILILLIVLSILGVFLSMYNIVVESGGKISGLSVVLVIFSVLLSLFILRLIYRLQGDITHLTQQFERLKKNVEEAKIQESSTVEKQSDETKQAFDDLAVDIIPEQKFDNEELFWENVLANIAKKLDIVQAVVYKRDSETKTFLFKGGFAYYTETKPPTFVEGETLAGQVAKNRETIYLNEIPEGYITILSGLGQGSPKHLLITPILDNSAECIAIVELASFNPYSPQQVNGVEKMMRQIGEYIQTIDFSTEEEHDKSK